MSWYSIEVQTQDDRREAVAAWLVGQTGQALEERDDGTLVSFAEDLPHAEALQAALAAAHGPGVTVKRKVLPVVDLNVAWRAGLGTRRVGRFAILPTWADHAAPPDTIVLTVDPEMAFGSGEHGSTRVVLALLEGICRPGDRVLDLGCGSGILSIAAAKLGASRVVGIEVDGDAVPVAQRNIERNGVADVVSLLEGDAAVLVPLLGPVDIVMSNILRLVNEGLLPEALGALRSGGTAIFSGMEPSEAEAFRPPLLRSGFVISRELIDEGWWAVAVTKP